MGKALVFNGVTVATPLKVIGIGIATSLKNYLNNIGETETSVNGKAFKQFFGTLNDAGLWSTALCIYPFFGSENTLQFGIIGNELTIPTGTSYTKGINFQTATGGGYGYNGKGIYLGGSKLLPSSASNIHKSYYFHNSVASTTSKILRVFDCMDTTSKIGEQILGATLGSGGVEIAKGYGLSKNMGVGNPIMTLATTYDTNSFKLYKGAELLSESTSYEYLPYNKTILGINSDYSSVNNSTGSFNMVCIFEGTHTAEQVAIVSSAIDTLCATIFEE